MVERTARGAIEERSTTSGRLAQSARWLVFGAVLVTTAVLREPADSPLDMAVVWLPTGAAVAGVFILGLPAAIVVALATVVQRLSLGYDWAVALGGAAGSASEAILGVLILRRLGLDRTFTRLRDVGAVLVAAIIAPLGSIACSWFARSWLWHRDMPFYSGWDGWWRMNALAVIMVLPAALTWSNLPRGEERSRLVQGVVAGTAAVVAVLLALLVLLPPTATGVLWLNLVLVGLAMFVAARFGMRGATLGTLVAGLVVVVATTHGLGPFVDLPHGERHVALQLFELALVALPAAFAAILGERQVAEAAARRSEALLASINRNVQDGLFRVDAGLHIVYANLALARLLGYEGPEALLGRSLADAFADEAPRLALIDLLQKNEHVHDEELRFQRHDGATFWALVSGTAVRDASGAVSHYDGALTDITTRKALEEQVRQSQKLEAVGRLAGGVAHDFNNLLTVIIGCAVALRDRARPGEPAAAEAEAICAAGTRAAALTHQLLAYSRRQVLSPQVIDASDVVAQMAGMLERIIGEHIRLVVERGPGTCWVRVDRSQLEQVLVNLAVNARDAMGTGGTLTLSTALGEIDEAVALAHPDWTAGPCVLVRVHDTGVGMEATVLAQAFEPFFTTKELGRGTGLGLATVYGIVKQSGGSVWLESSPGEGTTAYIALPRTAPPQVLATVEPAQATPARRSGTVLVVEDEPAVLSLVRRTLADRGYDVLAAGDGQRALDLAQGVGGRLDLVVTDIVMPGMDGRELARRLRAERVRVPVLFVSGYSDDAGSGEGFQEPGDAFLAKPFSPEVFLARVDALLGSSRAPAGGGSVPAA